MSTVRINGALFTLADCYLYKGVTFEWHHFCGPMLLKKNKDPARRKPSAEFYALTSEWHKLPKREREKFRV